MLIVGSGGREHALAWKIAQSRALGELHAAPGNPGIARHAHCHPVAASDAAGLVATCERDAIDLVVVGPEAPLVAGVADRIRAAGVAVFGPSAPAARIEGSKSFAKEVMRAARVPTATELDVPRAPCVVKADGLAAGKGVFVCRTSAEAEAALHRVRAFGGRPLVEELLEGKEVSLFAITDGAEVYPLPAARDYKRLLDHDDGPNTGGMGAYAPVLSSGDAEELVERVHRPVLAELARRGSPFVGLLYAGLMLTEDGPRVLEFNCRFGDPETQAILPLVGDVLPALEAAARGRLADAGLDTSGEAAVTVVVASAGYPDASATGAPIGGLDAAEETGALVFHAGTAYRQGRLVSAGGRVLNVSATAESIVRARARAYAAVERIELEGAQYRSDVAARAVEAADHPPREVARVAG